MLMMFCFGIVLVGVTFAIHAFGSMWWVDFLIRRYADRDGRWRASTNARVLTSTGVVLLLLHLLEALAWAMMFYMLPGETSVNTFEEALYLSIVTFTTLGYGDITLSLEWRLLSGIEAVNGILLAGWSAALLFTIVQRSWSMGHRPK